jgi:hypothetical protein
MLSTSLFPAVANHDKISFALAAPYQFRVFYYSDSFRKLFFDDKKEYLLLPAGIASGRIENYRMCHDIRTCAGKILWHQTE